MFLWYLAPVVADVTLGFHHHFWCSPVLRGCGMLGNLTPSKDGDTGCVCAHVSCWGAQTVRHIRQLPCHVPHHRIAAAPKTKITPPGDKAKTAKANVARLRSSPKHCWASDCFETVTIDSNFSVSHASGPDKSILCFAV